MEKTIYHGSDHIIKKPKFGYSNEAMRPDTDCANKKRKLPSMREKFSRIGSFSL